MAHYVGEGIGGGILNNFGGILTVTNSIISGNVAQGGDMTTQPGPGGFADGGGIANTAASRPPAVPAAPLQ